ncbi:MAG TPA: enhanced serine sensitivity protein SseB C-terminal domain-containing protein [Armatimonadota bacterium]|nr:enhanced serine sensitivity protein SseB C-terminal domain-containing protein [Armatimonadota bacterium]
MFRPENRLEVSLMKAATDPSHKPQFYRDLVDSDIFIIHKNAMPGSNGQIELPKGYTLKIRRTTINGKPYLPIFSSLTRLQCFVQEETTYLTLNALNFMEITQGADLVLNPTSDYGKEFSKEEVAAIIDGSIWRPANQIEIQKPTPIRLGKPAIYPTDLANALSRLFATMKEVECAYLTHYFNPEDGEKSHTLIAIQATGNWNVISASVGMVIDEVPLPDPPVDVMPLPESGSIADYFHQRCEPFYEKQ